MGFENDSDVDKAEVEGEEPVLEAADRECAVEAEQDEERADDEEEASGEVSYAGLLCVYHRPSTYLVHTTL